jgi:hypothetical protein
MKIIIRFKIIYKKTQRFFLGFKKELPGNTAALLSVTKPFVGSHDCTVLEINATESSF